MRTNHEPNQSPNAQVRGTIMVTNREWSQIAAMAERYTHAIQKTNEELADALFALFALEYNRLSNCMSDLDAAEHRYQTRKWYRIDQHAQYDLDIRIAKRAVYVQKDVVNNCIKILRAAVPKEDD